MTKGISSVVDDVSYHYILSLSHRAQEHNVQTRTTSHQYRPLGSDQGVQQHLAQQCQGGFTTWLLGRRTTELTESTDYGYPLQGRERYENHMMTVTRRSLADRAPAAEEEPRLLGTVENKLGMEQWAKENGHE